MLDSCSDFLILLSHQTDKISLFAVSILYIYIYYYSLTLINYRFLVIQIGKSWWIWSSGLLLSVWSQIHFWIDSFVKLAAVKWNVPECFAKVFIETCHLDIFFILFFYHEKYMFLLLDRRQNEISFTRNLCTQMGIIDLIWNKFVDMIICVEFSWNFRPLCLKFSRNVGVSLYICR